MEKRISKVHREYKIVYYNKDNTGLGLCERIPWFRNAYSLQQARQIKRKLENQGYINVDILAYDTTMYKIC